MTPQDYTALETALTQHAALETALAHNRDEVTAPILTRLRRENGTLRRENGTLRQENAGLRRRNETWHRLYYSYRWPWALELLFIILCAVCCWWILVITWLLAVGLSPIDLILGAQNRIFDVVELVAPAWTFLPDHVPACGWVPQDPEYLANSSKSQRDEYAWPIWRPTSVEGESESRPSLLLVIAVFTLPAFVASLTLGQDPVYNTALLADRVWTFCAGCAIWLRDKCFLASIAIFAVWALGVLPGGPNYWWIWQLQSRIFNWDSCAGLTVCYDEHGRPCQWVAPLAKEYCAPLDELYG